VILPARNEAASLDTLLPRLRTCLPEAEILVVDDGSQDDTVAVCRRHGVEPVRHIYGMGNGAAVKTGARRARGSILVCMDADGQHAPEQITHLLATYRQGYAMVVGSRTRGSQANVARWLANTIYKLLASWIVGHRIADLTSGLRVVDAACFRAFLHLLPNGFSYPATITMAFFRCGLPVAYVPVAVGRRSGRSHIRPLRDGLRFLLVIFRVGVLYSPLKCFAPISLGLGGLGMGYILYTYLAHARFTNMGLLLLVVAVLIFLMGLVSEQIAMMLYDQTRASGSAASPGPGTTGIPARTLPEAEQQADNR